MLRVKMEGLAPGETGTSRMYVRTLENGGLPAEARILALKLTKKQILRDAESRDNRGEFLPIDFSNSEVEFGCTKELLEEAINELILEGKIFVRSVVTSRKGRKAKRFVLEIGLD